MTNPTACLLVIGNEVLSGRTQDANIKFLATGLGQIGIPLREVRVIPDVAATIIGTVNEVRARYDHVFTTGGIGPTHDDITSECVAAAFGLPWEPHPEAMARMERHYQPGEFNAARQRMATMPRGASLIDNAVSIAPGFTIGNVHVMAGVPRIMQAMFTWLAPQLAGGPPIVSRAVFAIGLLGRPGGGRAARGAGAAPGLGPRVLPVLPRNRERCGAGGERAGRCGRGGRDRRSDGTDRSDGSSPRRRRAARLALSAFHGGASG